MELMQEKVDLKERVEELEHSCIQLSGETNTIGEWEGQGRGIGWWMGSLTAEPWPPAHPPAGEYMALYQSQRAMLKQRHREKEEYINQLAQDKEEMKVEALPISAGGGGSWGASDERLSLQVKLLELQELVLRLVGERNEWYGKFLAAAQNPAGESTAVPPAAQETGAAASQDGE